MITYNTTIDACAKNGKLDMAMKLFELLKQDSLQANATTYNVIINGCAKAGKWEKALDILQDLKDHGNDSENCG